MDNYEKYMRQVYFDERNYGSTENRAEFEEFRAKRLNETESGKYIFAEAKEDGTTRLFIKRLNIFSNVTTKDGWWDTFTITEKPCNKGIWLCRILKFTQDKDGYLMCIVYPVKNLGMIIDEESCAWDYFMRTKEFSTQYVSNHLITRFNCTEVENQCYEFWKHMDTPAMKEYYKKQGVPMYMVISSCVLNAFLDDKITLNQIEGWLDTPEGFEALALKIKDNLQEYSESYPLMIGKLKALATDGYISIDKIEDYVRRKYWEFDTLKRDGKITSELEETQAFERIEVVIQYWEDDKKAKKQARKDARKAKKANK